MSWDLSDLVDSVTRDDVREFVTHLIETRWPAKASVRFWALQQLFNWLVDEDEIDASPIEKLRPPTVPGQGTPVLSTDEARALLRACEGRDFASLRDTAIIRLSLDMGMPPTTTEPPATSKTASRRPGADCRAVTVKIAGVAW